MRQKLLRYLLGMFWALASIAATGEEIRVFAAASLTESLQSIGQIYQQKTGTRVTFNFGGSPLLVRQIEEGARADLFFSADEEKMDGLAKKDLLSRSTRTSLLGNTLVLVTEKEGRLRIGNLSELTRVKRLALADPQTVPAGIYARQYFEAQGVWSQLQGKIIPTENVRAALAAVESGNVEAAMVYKTDAAQSKKVRVEWEVLAESGPKISYPAAILKESRHPEEAIKFLQFLKSAEARSIFEKAGFIWRGSE